jgi:TonB family protein
LGYGRIPMVKNITIKENPNFLVSFIASLAIHLAIGGYIIYDFKDNLSIAKNLQTDISLDISFLQISDQNTQEEAVSMESKSSAVCQNEPSFVTKDELQPIDDIAKKHSIEKSKNKIEKKEIKKKKITTVKTETKKNSQNNDGFTSNIDAHNDFSNTGGNQSSSENNKKNAENGTNLIGLIYAALKKNTTYPKNAMEREIEGRVIVQFRLKDLSHFEFIKIVKSSDSLILDRHAIKIVESARRYFPPTSVGVTVIAPIVFNLNDNSI